MSDHAEHRGLTPITEEDLLRIANHPGGVNDQLRAVKRPSVNLGSTGPGA